jgi:hypothetical protein
MRKQEYPMILSEPRTDGNAGIIDEVLLQSSELFGRKEVFIVEQLQAVPTVESAKRVLCPSPCLKYWYGYISFTENHEDRSKISLNLNFKFLDD